MKNIIRKFTYPVLSIEAVDGDTFNVEIDRGFKDVSQRAVRLLHVDAPELSTEAGRHVMRVAQAWCMATIKSGCLMLDSSRLDMYGRVLGDLYVLPQPIKAGVRVTSEERLSAYMIDNGLGKPMNAEKRPTWTAVELAEAKARAEALL